LNTTQLFFKILFQAWVQFFPLLTIPFLTAFFPSSYDQLESIFWCLLMYLLAKVTEAFDRQIFKFTGERISGHTLKHLLASVGPIFLIQALLLRQRVASP
jgi:hypothetical protein